MSELPPRSSESEEMIDEEEELSFIRRNVQIRYVLTIMGFLCYAIFNVLRVSMSVAIVAMVKWENVTSSSPSNLTCNYTRPEDEDGPFPWDTPLQGHILACYFYGLFVTQYLGVRLAEKMNAKYTLLMGTILSSVATLLIPVTITDTGYTILFLQLIKGIGQGFIIPSFSVLMGKWIPKNERPFSMCLIGSGIPIGGVFGVSIAGVICEADSLGWEYVFYIYGGVGLVWCLFWIILIYESPLTHPFITHQELQRILKGIPKLSQKFVVPIRHILESGPVWAYVAVAFACYWAVCIYITVIPIFMATILKFGIEMNGIVSSFPYLLEALIYITTCILNRKLNEKERMKPIVIHKIFIGTGLSGFAISMITLTFTTCNRLFTILTLTLGLGMCGMSIASTSVIPIEISPSYAGTVSGITNTFAATAGIIIPTFIGYITREIRTTEEWDILFYISAVIAITAAIIFLVFGSSEVQKWNDPAFFHPKSYEEPEALLHPERSSETELKIQLAQAGISDQEDKDKLLPESEKDAPGPSIEKPKVEDQKPKPEDHEPKPEDQKPKPEDQELSAKPKPKTEGKFKKRVAEMMADRPWRTTSFEEIPKHPEPKIIIRS